MKNPFWSRTLLVSRFFFLAILLTCGIAKAQNENQVFFYSTENSPLSYLRVKGQNVTFMSYTDLSGKLEYDKDQIPLNSTIYVSGYGINDTLIVLQNVLKLDTIFLKTKEFILPEFEINSEKLNKLVIGDSNADGWDVKSPMKSANPSESGFYRYTIRVKVPRNEQLYLEKIKFYVSKILTSEVDLTLRVLVPKPTLKIKPGKNNLIQDFSELLPQNEIVQVKDPGWRVVAFNESVPVPKGVKDLFIVFDVLEKEPISNFALAKQKVSKNIDLGFYFSGGIIGLSNLDPIHPAVEITFLKE